MISRTRALLASPAFGEEQEARVARLLKPVALATVLYALLTGLYYTLTAPDPSHVLFVWLEVAVAVVIFSVSLFLLRVGQVRLASLWFVIVLWLLLAYDSYAAGGVRSPELFRMVLVPVFSGLLLGGRALIVTSVLTVLYMLGLLLAGNMGLLPAYDPGAVNDLEFVATWSGDLFLVTLLLYLAGRTIYDNLDRARRSELAQAEVARELQAVQASLEERVAARTRDLERRSAQLQATVDVSRAAASILDPEELMWQIAASIQDHFELYHVGIFQLDPMDQWAEYRAGAGESGRLLAAQGFRLQVGGASMIGWCTAHAQPRVTQDVRVETERIDRPEVALTQSEAALPLIARGRLIGALSVQSDRTDWFDPDTVAVLKATADQVAMAMDNARLFTESQRALEAAQRAYGEASWQAWTDLLRVRGELGYSYSRGALLPTDGSWPPEMAEAVQTRHTASDAHAPDRLAVPLRVRNQVVGALGFSKESKDETWTAEEVALVETLADQLGLALDSAQLFEEAQRHAAHEEAVRRVTDEMRRGLDVESILQTTVAELGRVLGVPRAYVRLGTGQNLEPTMTFLSAAKDNNPESEGSDG
jgi:GAF domain-containing protein